jgi:glycosyltransferase involved in cell wall biosynthesis
MAAGVLPVVSDRVGAAPDLVVGVGEVYPCGDAVRLTVALGRALALADNPETRNRMRQHAAKYCLNRTATGFEQAAFAASGDLYGSKRESNLQRAAVSRFACR